MIKLEKSTDECEAVPGKSIPFSTVVRNKGNFAAKVVLYDELPEGMAFVPNSVVKDGVPLPGANLDDGLTLGLVEPGEVIRVDFRLVLIPEQEEKCGKHVRNRMKAKVSFYSSNGRHVKETVLSNTVKLPVAKADKPLMYAKLTVEPPRAAPGDRLQYALRVGNEGHAAANVTLSAFVPKGTSYVPNSFTVDGKWINIGIPAKAGIPLGLLEPGERMTVAWEAAIPGISIVSPGQTIDNRALLSATYHPKDGGEKETVEFRSNQTAVELCFPVVAANLKAKPDEAYPDGIVDFRMLITNSGNRSAYCSADKLFSGTIHPVPGSLTVDGETMPDPGKGGRYSFGELEPGGTLKVQVQGRISPLAMTRKVRGQIVVQYEYRLNERLHAGETATNPYEITILYDNE
jgi:uncharacterized repeat protein (TIGR01451 family)